MRWVDLLVTSNQAYQAVSHRESTGDMKFSRIPNCVNPNERWSKYTLHFSAYD